MAANGGPNSVRRRGVTLLELVVVLVLMAISAVLVVPAVIHSSGAGLSTDVPVHGAAADGLWAPDHVLDPLLTAARRLAVKRGEPVRFRVADDGVWAVVALAGGPTVRDGRAPLPLRWAPDVVIDAMGTCLLTPAVAPPAGAVSWDALACRWRGAR